MSIFTPVDYAITQGAMQKWNYLSGDGPVYGITKKIFDNQASRKAAAALYNNRLGESARVVATSVIPSFAYGERAVASRIKSITGVALAGAVPVAALAAAIVYGHTGKKSAQQQANRVEKARSFEASLAPMDLTSEQKEHLMAGFMEGLIEEKDAQ